MWTSTTIEPDNYKNSHILKKILKTINKKSWDRSDISTDYFDVGFYLDLTQGNNTYGSQRKPFELTGARRLLRSLLLLP
jgi:hypothetical protein